MGKSRKMEIVDATERLKLFAESTKEYAIILLDPAGNIDHWNTGAKHLTGYTEKEVIGKNFDLFFTPEDRAGKRPQIELQKAKTDGHADDENWLVRKDSSRIWVSGSTTSLADKSGNHIGFAKVIRDLTDRREIEQQKDDFIAIASHELRTPLTIIKITRKMLQRHLEKQNDQKGLDYFHKVGESVSKLEHLLSELLNVAKLQNEEIDYEKEVFHMKDVIEDVIKQIEQTAKHGIKLISSTDKTILGYKPHIKEVLTNLLTNAVKYSPQSDKVEIRVTDDKQYVIVGVRDYGIGINEEDKVRIFQRFFRTINSKEERIPGIGLGLYITQRIIENHDGKIWVESEPGKGSTFFFRLPICNKQK